MVLHADFHDCLQAFNFFLVAFFFLLQKWNKTMPEASIVHVSWKARFCVSNHLFRSPVKVSSYNDNREVPCEDKRGMDVMHLPQSAI